MNIEDLPTEHEFQESYNEAKLSIKLAEDHKSSIQHDHYEWHERSSYTHPNWPSKHCGSRLDRSRKNADEALKQATTHKARVLTDWGIKLFTEGKYQEAISKFDEAIQCSVDDAMRNKVEHCKNLAIQESREEFMQQLDHLRIEHSLEDVNREIKHEIKDMQGHRNWIRSEIYKYDCGRMGRVSRSNYLCPWNDTKDGWIPDIRFNRGLFEHDSSRADCGLNNAKTNKAIILNILGNKLFYEKRYDEALAKYDEALGIPVHDHNIHLVFNCNKEYLLGSILLDQQKFTEAAEKFWDLYKLTGQKNYKLRAIEATSEQLKVDGRVSEIQDLQHDILFEAIIKNYKAERLFEEGKKLFKSCFYGSNDKKPYSEILKTIAEAIVEYGKAIKECTSDFKSKNKFKQAELDAHDAWHLINELITHTSNVENGLKIEETDCRVECEHNNRGKEARQSRNYEEAVDHYKKSNVLEVKNNLALCLDKWGYELYIEGRYDEASEKFLEASTTCLEKYEHKSAFMARHHICQANILLEEGKYEKAGEDFHLANRAYHNAYGDEISHRTYILRLLDSLARASCEKGDLDEAMERLNESSRLGSVYDFARYFSYYTKYLILNAQVRNLLDKGDYNKAKEIHEGISQEHQLHTNAFKALELMSQARELETESNYDEAQKLYYVAMKLKEYGVKAEVTDESIIKSVTQDEKVTAEEVEEEFVQIEKSDVLASEETEQKRLNLESCINAFKDDINKGLRDSNNKNLLIDALCDFEEVRADNISENDQDLIDNSKALLSQSGEDGISHKYIHHIMPL